MDRTKPRRAATIGLGPHQQTLRWVGNRSMVSGLGLALQLHSTKETIVRHYTQFVCQASHVADEIYVNVELKFLSPGGTLI